MWHSYYVMLFTLPLCHALRVCSIEIPNAKASPASRAQVSARASEDRQR